MTTLAPVGAATVEQVVRAQLSKALGGRRGMLEAAVPTIAFTLLFFTTRRFCIKQRYEPYFLALRLELSRQLQRDETAHGPAAE